MWMVQLVDIPHPKHLELRENSYKDQQTDCPWWGIAGVDIRQPSRMRLRGGCRHSARNLLRSGAVGSTRVRMARRIACLRLPVRRPLGHAVNMHRYLAPVRDLEELTAEQRRFLTGVAARIPRLLEAVKAGAATASFKLGTRRLDDGRHVELELVARVPEGRWDGIAGSWGQVPPGQPADEEAHSVDTGGPGS